MAKSYYLQVLFMNTVVAGSNHLVVDFYSSYLAMLEMENESYSSISVGIKRALVNSSINTIFIIIETHDDLLGFNKLKLSIDTNLVHLIIISMNEDVTKQATSSNYIIYNHKEITSNLAPDLAKLQICKPYMQENSSLSSPEKILKHVQAMLINGRISLPVKQECGLSLLAALEDNDISFKEIGNMTKTDPALHSGIIKMANSVYFSGAFSSVTDVEKALVRVGLSNVKVYLINFINKSLATNKDLIFVDDISKSIEKSLLTASLCYVMAENFKVSSPVMMFSVGLMSYIGEIFMYAAISDYFSGSGLNDSTKEEYRLLTQNVGLILSGKLLQKWKFSEDYSRPIINTSSLSQNKSMSETRILHLAINMLDFYENGERDTILTEALENTQISITDALLETIRSDTQKHLSAVKSILS